VKYDHWLKAQKVCVIGAGTMGSGIAAHLANIGFEVVLLDLSLEAAEAGLDRARQARPPHFFTHQKADSISVGSINENLGSIADSDWVVEAIYENLDAKRKLFAEIEPILSPEAMITTNTSGLEIGSLADGLSPSFQERFMGTHFFNPPRYLKLLELIPTQTTDPEAVKAVSKFLEERVARRVVVAKDTPGFIANRFGMWSMFNATHVTERLRLCIEDVDVITGPFLGRPRSASFRLNDIVGLDIMLDIANHLRERCPTDPFIGALQAPKSLTTLISKGWIGDKAGQGYYKKEGKELVAFDLQTMAYRMRRESGYKSLTELKDKPLGERIRLAMMERDEVGEFLRLYLVPTLRYAAYLKQEISHSVADFDHVMMWGFGWEKGPFGLIDAIGAEHLGIEEEPFYKDGMARSFEGKYVSIPKSSEYKPLTEYKVLESMEGFNVRDLGDKVHAICLTTKMGTLNPALVIALNEFVESSKLKRFVFTSEARSFSAGYDLRFFADRVADDDFAGMEEALKQLQSLATKFSERASVAAIFGHCLGGGYELAARCSIIAALAETQIGLPESKVGLIPAGGGTALMRLRNQATGAKGLSEVVLRLTSGVVATNADEARLLGYLRPTDVVVYHPDRLIHDAKHLALKAEPRVEEELVPMAGPLSGMIDTLLSQRRQRGEFTEYDEQIGLKLKTVFSKASSFDDALERERQMFLDLAGRQMTILRIKHMLDNGKALKN
jgi:3-hydroxyacyl-CoA dehydrogenase